MEMEKVHIAVVTINEIVKSYPHMAKPWEMIFGGLILPFMADIDKSVQEKPQYKALLEEYAEDKIKKYFSAPVAKGGGKYRRLKGKVNKLSRMERGLNMVDRDEVIRWWNKHQTLVPKEDPICVKIADDLNKSQPGINPLAPLQVGGYFSYLCRMGLVTEKVRKERFNRAQRKGYISILPEYTPEILKAVQGNYNAQREEEARRAVDHAELRKRRASGDSTPVVVESPSAEDLPLDNHTAPVKTVEPKEETEDFDVKFL